MEARRDTSSGYGAADSVRDQAARTVFQLTSDLVTVVDISGDDFVASMVNRAWTESTGWTRDELIGRPLADLFPQPVAGEVRSRLRYSARRSEPVSYEVTHDVPAGRRHYHVTLWPLLEKGRVRHVVAITRDLTHLRQVEAALEETQQLARIGHWGWDLEADELVWSPELFHIYGVSSTRFDPTVEDFLAMVHPDDREHFEQLITDARKAGESFEHAHRIVRPDGEERVVVARGRTVADATGHPIRMFGTAQDVTAAHRRASRHLQGLRSVQGVEEVLGAVGDGLNDETVLDWLTYPHDGLDGEPPIGWLATRGEVDRVRDLAETDLL